MQERRRGAIEAADDLPHRLLHEAELALRLPEPAGGGWHAPGLSARAERLLDIGGGVLVLLFAIGWIWTIAHARIVEEEGGTTALGSATGNITAALTNRDAPTAAFVNDAVLEALTTGLRGRSGRLRAVWQKPGQQVGGAAEEDAHLVAQPAAGGDTVGVVRTRPGLYRLAAAVGNALRPISDLTVITMLPFETKQGGRIGSYRIGSWPGERGRVAGPARAPAGKYANPAGFIEVTRENQNTYVSEHFRLRDFLTHDQQGTWPKYLVLRPELIDKLELILKDLQEHGYDTKGVRVMSGFRTPQYNVGGGNTGGRANLSRHMYGDASDMFIDNNGDGNMDDLNRDGRVNIQDARIIAAAADRVEKAHPELIGGVGVYVACCGHGPFIHIDTRGYRARWTGTGGG